MRPSLPSQGVRARRLSATDEPYNIGGSRLLPRKAPCSFGFRRSVQDLVNLAAHPSGSLLRTSGTRLLALPSLPVLITGCSVPRAVHQHNTTLPLSGNGVDQSRRKLSQATGLDRLQRLGNGRFQRQESMPLPPAHQPSSEPQGTRPANGARRSMGLASSG